MGMCGPAQALKSGWPDGEAGVIINSRLVMAPPPPILPTIKSRSSESEASPRGGGGGPPPPHGCCHCFEPPRWESEVQGSGLTTGGRLPDSRKPGPDGVGWGGKGPGEASWTVAQCGDCLSAQALGHAATPPWARAPALGYQREVTGGLAFPRPSRDPPPHQLLQKAPPPKTAFSHRSLQACECPSNSFSVSALKPGSLSHCAIPTVAVSHLGLERGRLCCYTAPICPTSFHAVDHDAAAWHSGRRKDFGRYTGAFQAPPPLHFLHSLCQPHAQT